MSLGLPTRFGLSGKLLALVIAPVLLAACAQTSGSSSGPSGGQGVSTPGATVGASSLAAPGPQRTAILRPAPNPQSLLGVSQEVVQQALGNPPFAGRDGDAHIWRYSGRSCALLVIFYREDDGTIRSTHLDARKPQGGSAPVEACLKDVVNTPKA